MTSSEIKLLSKNCNFCTTCHDGLIRDRIVIGIRDTALQQKLLSDEGLTLKRAEDACRAREKAKQGSKMLGSNVKSEDSEDVDINELTRRLNNHRPFNIHPRGARFKDQPNRSRTQHKPPPTQNLGPFCKFCVGHHRRGRQYCPGWGTINVRHVVKRTTSLKAKFVKEELLEMLMKMEMMRKMTERAL